MAAHVHDTHEARAFSHDPGSSPLARAGSVRFVRDVPINSPSSGVTSTAPHPGVSWGGAQSRAGLEMMPLSLEAIHGAEAARGIAPVDVRTLVSLLSSVAGGARQIHRAPAT